MAKAPRQPNRRRLKVKEGSTYYPEADSASRPFRRVIRILGEVVFYSVGGNSNYCCKLQTFRRAVRRPKQDEKSKARG